MFGLRRARGGTLWCVHRRLGWVSFSSSAVRWPAVCRSRWGLCQIIDKPRYTLRLAFCLGLWWFSFSLGKTPPMPDGRGVR
jgi:hypothetical protein